jgi:hypothetical protein
MPAESQIPFTAEGFERNSSVNVKAIDPLVQPPAPHPHVALTPEQLARLRSIGTAYRALRRAANVAAFSGITTLALGVLSGSCLMLDASLGAVAITLALCAFGAIEMIGRQRLLKGQGDSLRILAWNQLAFFAAVTIYCGVQIATFSTASLISAEDQATLKQVEDATGSTMLDPKVWKPLNTAMYAAIIMVSLASQGGLAWYYARRKKPLDVFRSASDAEKQLLLQIAP